jgi:predicted nucleic acid-binding protein
LAHGDLLALPVAYFPYEPFGARVWELRDNVTCYDAGHMALAEHLDASMSTLDQKLTKASGTRCDFLTVPNDHLELVLAARRE